MASLVYSLVYALGQLVELYETLILVYIIMSWVPTRRGILYTVYSALGQLCEPYLGLFRRFIRPVAMLDFSPIVALLALQVGMNIIWRVAALLFF